MKIALSSFALDHFITSEYTPSIPGISPTDFIKKINSEKPCKIEQGYAPFCQIFYYNNFTEAKVGIIPIEEKVLPFIQSGYESRRDTELPVLTRWIDGSLVRKKASYLGLILYSQRQMKEEGEDIDADYAIVGILRLCEMIEPPLPPITIMRNALGFKEGGSGVQIDRDAYIRSVEFWNKNISVKPERCQI